VLKTHSHA
jgi:hypothetical protein